MILCDLTMLQYCSVLCISYIMFIRYVPFLASYSVSNLNSSFSASPSQNFPTHFITQIWVHLVCVIVGFLLGCACYRVMQSGYEPLIQWWSHCLQCIPQQPGHTRVSFAYVSAIPAARTQALAVSACLGSSYTTLSINESDLLV